MNTNDFQIYGNIHKGDDFIDSLDSGTFLFSMVMSYTATCETLGISIAGADVDSFKFTPPADAEYLHYGYCKVVDEIPMTPDGKPTPALLTKAALESASIPHLIINAGSRVVPHLPYVETGLSPGNNIRHSDAMSMQQVAHAVDYGRMVGRSLAPLADCLVVGESIPGGTTTAMAILHGLGFPVRVSSSMPNNPVKLKERVVSSALLRIANTGASVIKTTETMSRISTTDASDNHNDSDDHNNDNDSDDHNNDNDSDDHNNDNDSDDHNNDNHNSNNNTHGVVTANDYSGSNDKNSNSTGRHKTDQDTFTKLLKTPKPLTLDSDPAKKLQYLYQVVAGVGDPMIPFVAGMLSSASMSSKVMLAGGTQMAAVLAFASGIGFDDKNVAVGTTSYVADDVDADFSYMMSHIADVPAVVIDPGLDNSKYAGLRAFSSGYAKEGVGAGGCMISAMLKSGIRRTDLVDMADSAYKSLF